MLINTLASAVAPEADAGFDAAMVTRPLAGFGPGAAVRERSWNALLVGSGAPQAGIAGAGAAAAGGFGLSVVDAVRLTQARPGGVKGSTVQISTVQNSTVQNSTVQNSTVQHDTDQMTRLYPATRGGVGPHPAREPGPV